MLSPARAAFVVCLLLALLHTWPIARSPAHESLDVNADVDILAWTLSWIARAIVTQPLTWIDGNIFAPEPHVLLYTDPILVPALMGAPVRWLGGSPILTFNLVLVAGLTLTAWAGWLVAWRWTGSFAAALVAGTLLAFNGHLLTRLAHIPAAHIWGVPLTIWLTDRILERPARNDVFLLPVVVLATAVTSAYTLALVGVCVGASLAIGVAYRRWRSVALIVVGSLAGLVLASPVLWPYMRFAATGVGRPIEQVADFSATLSGYLTSVSHVHAGWTSVFFRDDLNVFFAGVTAIVLAVLGAISTRGEGTGRRRMLLLLLVAGGGVLLSLGPATAVYRWLYDWVPPLRGLRAAARFGYLYLAAVGLAAAYGFRAIEQRFGPAGRTVWAVAALALITLEAWSGPALTRPFARIPGIYAGVAASAEPVVLVEVPFYPTGAIHDNGEYVLNSTAHWRPLMNGYSGFIPDSYRRRAMSFWYFPDGGAIDEMKREGATHVMVHLERFAPSEVAAIERALPRRTDLVLLSSDALGHRLYRFR